MNLKPRREDVTVQNEVLKTTQGLIFKVGGITLDGSLFSGVVKAGTPVSIKAADGLAKPYADTDPASDEVYVTTHDVVIQDAGNAIVGAFEEAYFDQNKVTFSAAFMSAADGRYKVR